ncbi:MAG TPA: amino acid ABC transporter permease [Bacillota bacterium]|nr:amino acid ABC transporter permease [Bacillota bacterium]HPF42841.1 amino acid ABC transporter permease [Bacillota bacterium]HPQ62372.1 amino acid ABC transporter permease [Bacillota bacterium]
MDIFDYEKIKPWIPYLAKGIGITLLIAFVAAIVGFILGVVLVLMNKRKFFRGFARGYIDIFRGTPMLLQLSIIYFAIPQLLDRIFNDGFGMNVDFAITALMAAFITFGLNSAAYVSEIIRSGINSVDPGEIEAAKALGISKYHMYKDIVLPKAFKNSFPALVNEFVTLIKETSIVSVIGIQDLFRRQQIVTAQTYLYFEALIIIGVFYYVLIKVFSLIARRLEVIYAK